MLKTIIYITFISENTPTNATESASSDQVARLMRLFLGEGIVSVFTFMGQNNVVANPWW